MQVSNSTSLSKQASKQENRTSRPVGAPGMAICLVLMTVRGNKHVVTPCNIIRALSARVMNE